MDACAESLKLCLLSNVLCSFTIVVLIFSVDIHMNFFSHVHSICLINYDTYKMAPDAELLMYWALWRLMSLHLPLLFNR